MARLLFLLHSDSTHAGGVGAWAAQRRHVATCCCPRLGDPLPEPGCVDATVIFGGPMSANDAGAFLDQERAWMARALQRQDRLFGICLGAQLMAQALGGTVGPHPEGRVECGYTWVDPADVPEWLGVPCPVYHWHQEGFTLPPGARLLARGRGAFPIQGFAHGRSLAVQFHPEATDTILERWLARDPQHLQRPGAQAPAAHWAEHQAHAADRTQWLFRTLDRWIGTP